MQRLRVVLIALLGVLRPGLACGFLRPAQYCGTVSVLTAATPEMGMHLAVQERVMRGQELSKRTLEQAGADSAGE